MTTLEEPLTLPCGTTIRNRILKSAMSEILGTPTHGPSPELIRLYERWAQGGLGLQITGNVMIDGSALGEPGNVVLEDDRHLPAFQSWAAAGTADGTALWMQLNHPGKQSPKFLSSQTVAPSAIGFGPGLAGAFGVPRELTEAEIEDLITRYARAAGLAAQAGFTGVQIHGAHGYLVSQFLSPKHNQRTDDWGGPLENRFRFLDRVYRAIRTEVGDNFPVSVKLNSADFQKGGFSEEESLQVVEWLANAGMDLIEISGGTYEAPVMTGYKANEREGYFLDFVEKARGFSVPLCVTGGFRTPAGMQRGLDQGCDMVGLARTLCIQPDFAGRVLAGEAVESQVRRVGTGIKTLDRLAAFDVTWYENQLARMGTGKDPNPRMSAWRSFGSTVFRTGLQSFKKRRAGRA